MLDFQRLLLGDQIRNDAFAKALKHVIVPGKTVVADIGSGTGYLSFLAEKFGAKECHLFEMSPAMDLSKTLAKRNDIKNCRFHFEHSTAVKKPPQADVVVSETLGNWAYEENIIETLNDARRFLKKDGVMIPQSIRCFVAPVIAPRLYDELNAWDRVGYDLDFSDAKKLSMNNMYVKDIVPEDLLPSPPQGGGAGGGGLEWDRVDLTNQNSSIREKTVEWTPQKPLTLYGFACWWEATLIKGITLSTSPAQPSTHWKQIYLPLVDPLPIRPSDSIHLHLRSDSRYEIKINVEWETSIVDGNGKILKKTDQDMRRGYN